MLSVLAEKVIEALDQRAHLHWFGKAAGESHGIREPAGIAMGLERSERDDLSYRELSIGSDGLTQFEPAHPGQMNVRDDKVEGTLLAEREGETCQRVVRRGDRG